ADLHQVLPRRGTGERLRRDRPRPRGLPRHRRGARRADRVLEQPRPRLQVLVRASRRRLRWETRLVRVYVAGPLFSEAERTWVDALAARLRAEGHDCFVPHENFRELADVTLEEVYRIDSGGLRSANARVAWLDGPMVDDGTACELGMFAELVRSGGDQYLGIVAITTDLRLE